LYAFTAIVVFSLLGFIAVCFLGCMFYGATLRSKEYVFRYVTFSRCISKQLMGASPMRINEYKIVFVVNLSRQTLKVYILLV